MEFKQKKRSVFFQLYILMVLCSKIQGQEDSLEEQHSEEQSDRTGKQIIRIPATECSLGYDQYPTASCDGIASCLLHRGKLTGICPTKIGICCLVIGNCGAVFPMRTAYFQNNWYPKPTAATGTCSATVESYHSQVTQVKLEFLTFVLAQPNVDGVCEDEGLTIEGITGDIPELCGDLTGQHIYVNLDPEGDGAITLNVKLVRTSNDTSMWNILINQYLEKSDLKASRGCLQYYTEAKGVVRSFNSRNQHLASQNYEACVSMPSSSCTLNWSSRLFDVSPNVSSSDECTRESYDRVVIGGKSFCGNSPVQVSTDDYKLRVSFDGDENSEGVSRVGRTGFIFGYERTCS